jgi:hypothetical protein
VRPPPLPQLLRNVFEAGSHVGLLRPALHHEAVQLLRAAVGLRQDFSGHHRSQDLRIASE